MTDTTSGEVMIEKKFHKPSFDEVMTDPEYAPYIDNLLEAVMIKKLSGHDYEIDPESYEEIRSIALEGAIE